jgi:hypothetical protein
MLNYDCYCFSQLFGYQRLRNVLYKVVSFFWTVNWWVTFRYSCEASIKWTHPMFARRKWLTVMEDEKWRSENGYCTVITFDIIVIVFNYWWSFSTYIEHFGSAIGLVGDKVVVLYVTNNFILFTMEYFLSFFY